MASWLNRHEWVKVLLILIGVAVFAGLVLAFYRADPPHDRPYISEPGIPRAPG